MYHVHPPNGRVRRGLAQLEDGDPGPHRDDVCDLLLADRRPLGRFARLPLLGQLTLTLGQTPLLVAEVGGLLELLVLDRVLLGPAGLLDLILELAVDRR